MATDESVSEAADVLVAAMIAAIASHGDLPPGHHAEPIKITIEQAGSGTSAGLVWRDARPDGSNGIHETTWTLSHSLATPRAAA